MKTMIVIRNAFGGRSWGGVEIGGSWTPAITGALNQTGLSDEEASTADSNRQLVGLFELVTAELPNGREMSSEEDGYDGFEIRLLKV